MKSNLAASIIGLAGVVVALATGLVEHTPMQLVGATWYGYPLAWLYRLVLAPRYYPWRFDVSNLVLDVLFWALLSFVILFLATRIRGPSKNRQSSMSLRMRPPGGRSTIWNRKRGNERTQDAIGNKTLKDDVTTKKEN